MKIDLVDYCSKENGISRDEGYKVIENGINYLFDNCDEEKREYLKKIHCKGERPTPDEFLEHIINELSKNFN